jgi:hypothetical protein
MSITDQFWQYAKEAILSASNAIWSNIYSYHRRASLRFYTAKTQSVGLPPPFQSEQFCMQQASQAD